MELQQLRYAAAVYRERHFVRAAAAVNVSQPTLSLGLKKLERELSVRLFDRSPRGVRATAEGEKFLAEVLPALEVLESAVDRNRSRGGAPLGTVRLGTIPTLGPYLLPPLLVALSAAAPGVTLEIHEFTTSVLLERLAAGRLDLGFLALPTGEKGLVERRLGVEEFWLAVEARHPLARRRWVRTADLARENLLILQEGHCFRDQSLAFCDMSPSDPRVVFEGSSLASVMRLAAAGHGVTLVPALAVEPKLHPGLRFVPFAPPAPRRTIGVAWRSRLRPTTAWEAVVKAARTAWESGSRPG
jgi:LysR family hydrogen peroxide-inducible transcriptional activator